MDHIKQINDYLENHLSVFTEELIEWLKIPSISTLAEHSDDVHRAAQWIQKRLEQAGFPHPELIETERHPLVYAHWLVDPAQPTLLIYGHYDVQPTDPLELWESPPFSPVVKGNDLFARGSSDDKGQVMLITAALEGWSKTDGQPPINIKIILEGEEEAGGESIEKYVHNNKEKLAADAVLICDTHMPDEQQPSLITGLRGILYTELEVRGAKTDLHSGSYGGVAPNPLHALCLLVSALKNEDGVINIPELQAALSNPSEEDKRFWEDDPLDMEQALREEMGVSHLVGERDFPPLERLGVRPTLEVHGITGGFAGEGAKTVIPATASAKISLRLPPELSPQKVFDWLQKSVDRCLPKGYSSTLTNVHAGSGVAVHQDNPFFKAAAQSLEMTYNTTPVMLKEGGSIPVAALFHKVLRLPVVLMGFALPDDNIHAPNEKFNINQFLRGMQTVATFIGMLRRP